MSTMDQGSKALRSISTLSKIESEYINILVHQWIRGVEERNDVKKRVYLGHDPRLPSWIMMTFKGIFNEIRLLLRITQSNHTPS